MTAPANDRAQESADQTERPRGIVGFLESPEARRYIESMLPPGAVFARVVREVARVCSDNPTILDCTPRSILYAVGQAVAWDLEIGVTAHLVPYNVKVKKTGQADRWEKRLKAILDYKGKIELALRYRAARLIDAHCVFANEHYRCAYGTNPFIEHTPVMDPKERGALRGAYAYARLSQYDVLIVELSEAEINTIRQEYSKQWTGGSLEDLLWYVRKTVLHQLMKLIPKTPQFAAALAAGERADEDEAESIPLDPGTSVARGSDAEASAGGSPSGATGSEHPGDGAQQERATESTKLLTPSPPDVMLFAAQFTGRRCAGSSQASMATRVSVDDPYAIMQAAQVPAEGEAARETVGARSSMPRPPANDAGDFPVDFLDEEEPGDVEAQHIGGHTPPF